MPHILKPGAIVNGYEIVRMVSRGTFAIAYQANSQTGSVFFKQYRLPNPAIEWFPDFVNHQLEIKHCIESDFLARHQCYRFIEFFVDNGFYQVFEFVDSQSLTSFLDDAANLSWQRRVLFAKFMMLAVKTLHDKNIIHSDLKPDNIILIPDVTSDIGYQLKIIDLDWAFFSDKPAPWDGKQGYVGSHNFMSPEHIEEKIPSQASDIFTCGIILGLLLGGQHPFHENLDEAYHHAAFRGIYSPVRVMQAIDGVDRVVLEATINACLDTDPSTRPSADALCRVLNVL